MRSAATSVSVFQWPCGTLATRRSPRGERPRCRTILVVTAVSSMKTRRGASSLDCSTFSAARAAATSGRSCSAACKVFFERDVVAFVEAPDRGRTGFQPLLALEPRANLFERQVRLRCDQIKQPLAMLLERRATVARAGQCRYTARCRPALDPADCGRGAKTEQPRRFPSALAVFDKRHRRALRSLEYPFAIARPRRCCQNNSNLICAPLGTPLLFRFTSTENRSRWHRQQRAGRWCVFGTMSDVTLSPLCNHGSRIGVGLMEHPANLIKWRTLPLEGESIMS